jgi:uncharacterized membrane-anchored protein YjiN (DUF445 family)
MEEIPKFDNSKLPKFDKSTEKIERNFRDQTLGRIVSDLETNILNSEAVSSDPKLENLLIDLISAVREKLTIREKLDEYTEDTINDIIKESQERIKTISAQLSQEYPKISNYIEIRNLLEKRAN